MPDIASKNYSRHCIGYSVLYAKIMLYLKSFFYTMSGVKKIPSILPAITFPTSGLNLSFYISIGHNSKHNTSYETHISKTLFMQK